MCGIWMLSDNRFLQFLLPMLDCEAEDRQLGAREIVGMRGEIHAIADEVGGGHEDGVEMLVQPFGPHTEPRLPNQELM